MKKFFGLILCMLLTVCTVFGIAGCGSDRSSDGNFPSDVAIQNGYAGSVGEWLSSDDGGSTLYRKLYEEAKESGEFEGTYLEFLKQVLEGGADLTPAVNRALLSVVSIQCMYAGASGGAAGAGVIVSYDETTKDMVIVTNYHVVYNADTRSHFPSEIYVWLYGTRTLGNCLSAEYAFGALNYDLAVLNVRGDTEARITESGASEVHTNRSVLEKSTPVAVRFADSDDVTVGDPVFAVGNPLDESVSVSHGIVSVDAEEITLKGADAITDIDILVMRTDAPINHGNSGGGLFNAAGELIGVVNARSEDSDAVVLGVGYAIPANRVRNVVDNLIANNGTVTCARLSCTVSVENSHTVYDEVSGKTYLEDKIVVQDVSAGAGAAANLMPGDTIVSAKLIGSDGTVKAERNFTRLHYLSDFLLCVRAQDTVELVVSREGSPVTLTLKYDRARYFEEIK